MAKSLDLTLVIDPRFPGGTSTAVATEISVLAPLTNLRVVAIESKMFKGKTVHSAIQNACDLHGIEIEWSPKRIRSSQIVVHNPTFLKFNQTLETRFYCNALIVVCHENFVRPNGNQSFDVEHCLALIEQNALASQFLLAPVSNGNRQSISQFGLDRIPAWELADFTWNNICDFDLADPTRAPIDRRGRHSRAGYEKFPSEDTMDVLFPPNSETRILGADAFIAEGLTRDHWELLPFGTEDVHEFLQTIDFFVYYTNPMCRESFGRVIAEALAAGKVVVTDPQTGATFGDGVVKAEPKDVDQVIKEMIKNPEEYCAQALRGQKILSEFSAQRFGDKITKKLNNLSGKTSYALL